MFALWGSLNPNRFASLLVIGIIINLHIYFISKKRVLLINLLFLIISIFDIFKNGDIIIFYNSYTIFCSKNKN